MQFRQLCSTCLFLCLAHTGTAIAQTIDFDGAINDGDKTIKIKGTKALVSVLPAKPGDKDCGKGGLVGLLSALDLVVPGSATTTKQVSFDPASSRSITLATPVKSGEYLCLVGIADANPKSQPYYSPKPQPVGQAPPAPGVAFFVPPVAGTSTIAVTGTAGDSITVLAFPPDYTPKSSVTDASGTRICTAADIQTVPQKLAFKSETAGAADTSFTLTADAGASQAIQLQSPLNPGAELCIDDIHKSGKEELSDFATASTASSSALQFTGELVAGSSTFTIQGSVANEVVSVYLFGAGYPFTKGKDTRKQCQDTDRAHGTQLTMVGTGTSTTTTNITKIPTANSPIAITLTNPVTAGTRLCVFGSPRAGAANDEWSNFKRVSYFTPGEDYGRFAVTLTGGVMISNEQQSSTSSTASQYFDLGLSFAVGQPGESHTFLHPGFSTLMDMKLTSVPVAASTSTPTASPSSPTLDQSLNVLSSQQSATLQMGFYLPIRLTNWYHKTNWITAAPLVLGGFDTLLNPSNTGTTPATTSSSNPVATTTFNSVYNFRAVGARFAWDIYSKNSDEAPIEYSWINLTVGQYSNLTSWRCTISAAESSASGFTPPTGIKSVSASNGTTSCGSAAQGSNATPNATTLYESRKLVPRLDIAGELKLPSYPVVFGYDANLGQYLSHFGGNKIDIDNKPGNDVRFYFGLKFNIASALSKLGVPTQ